MSFAVEIENVSKEFRIPRERFASVKERLLHMGKVEHDVFHALNDINIEIKEGETYALLGHNGSGKSTLLKCVAGILRPTTGQVKVRGRMAALLELGAGFHPDLTGRENVFMNATLLGISQREIERRFDEIVAFAELEDFIDNQVKHYSSGMYVRLGFAVAVNMDPDVLLVDEVLAVGDEAFQRKCVERIRQFQADGRTIVVVTHSADMVRQLCDRAAVLDHGDKVAEGNPGEAIRTYREYLMKRGVPVESVDSEVIVNPDGEEEAEDGTEEEVVPERELTAGELQARKSNKRVAITNVELVRPHSDERPYLLPGEPLTIRADYVASEPTEKVVFGVSVHDLEGRVVFGWNTEQLDVDVPVLDGSGTIVFDIGSIPLLDGDYMLSIAAHDVFGATVYDWHEQEYRFEVMNPLKTEGLVHTPVKVSFSH